MGKSKEAVSVVIYRQKEAHQPELFLANHSPSSKEAKNNGAAHLIGGLMENNEMPLDAIIRHLRTQIVGLEDEFTQNVLWQKLRAWGSHPVSENSLNHSFFLAAEDIPLPSQEIQLQPSTQKEGLWLSPAELRLIAVALLDKTIIESLLEKKRL